MSIKQRELEIVSGDAFKECQLGRKKYADVLTSIVSTYSDGFVLAINNKWGTGKTTFVKMWQQDLKDNGFQTVYFNAWENDFENNPLIALMGELKKLTKKDTEPEFKDALKKAAVLSKHILPMVAKAVADRYLNMEDLGMAIQTVTEGVTSIFENEVNSYADKKKGIHEFRTSLSHFVAETNEVGKPLVFIIDELDRCRPDYAVSILEQIKHFFSIPQIVFVLSIDKEQLGNAVRGVYGSERIDADEYLRRFIDVEYSIPDPESPKFVEFLYQQFDFDSFFNSSERKKYDAAGDSSDFIKVAKFLFGSSAFPLRMQEKIMAHTRIVMRTFAVNDESFAPLLLLLIYLKNIDNELYRNLQTKRMTMDQVQDKLYKILTTSLNSSSTRDNIRLEAYLVHFYNNYIAGHGTPKDLYSYDAASGIEKLIIKSRTDNSVDQEVFLSYLKSINNSDYYYFDLGIFFSKINLTEQFKL